MSCNLVRSYLGKAVTCLAFLQTWQATASPENLSALVADRKAVELVYYHHRTGQQPPFDQVLPPATLEALVKTDINKEAILKRQYGVTVSDAMVEAEMHRIDTTTHAPDILAELKGALGNDQFRFGHAVARPIIVERELRDRFENDDALHAPQRQQLERIRSELIAAKKNGLGVEQLLSMLKEGRSNQVTESSWQLSVRPAGKDDAGQAEEIRMRFGPNAQILSSTGDIASVNLLYISDLPPLLQKVMQVQLVHPGDISAVIETDIGFLLYLARQRTAERLDVACLTVGKRDYDSWLREKSEELQR